MPSIDLSNYVEVPERIRIFKAKYPNGTLNGQGEFVRNKEGDVIGYHYAAAALTNDQDNPLVGVGTAYEPIPGKTPYTKDSEVMNAETSAWGRAIAALGFDFGKIASQEEVRARQGQGEEGSSKGGF